MHVAGTRRWWAVVALAVSVLAFGVDATVLNLALPTLATDLHASTAQLQWFIDAYSLVIAAMLLPAGLLGDRFGRKRLLLAALAVFGLASIGCAYAPSAGWLIAARALLGLGAAFLLPLALAVLPVLFSEEERPRALSLLIGATIIAYPIGPLLGGWLLTHFWWGSVFLINVPVVVVALIAVGLLLPESRGDTQARMDIGGIILSSLGLVTLTYGVIEAGDAGWGATRTLAALLAGVVVLGAFVLWEQRVRRDPALEPLIDLALFRSAGFTWGTILATIVSFAMFGLLFTVPQYEQAVRGEDAMGAGVRLLPLIGGLIIGGVLADRLTRRAGAQVTVALGFGLLAAGLMIGATTRVDSSDQFTIVWITIIGAGLGFALPAAMDGALGALSPERSGVGSALIQTMRQVGGTFGVAVLGSILSIAYRSHMDLTGLSAPAADAVQRSVAAGVAVARQLASAPLLASVRDAFVHGMDVMLWVCGGLAALGIVLALVFLPRRSGAVEERAAERVESPHEIAV